MTIATCSTVARDGGSSLAGWNLSGVSFAGLGTSDSVAPTLRACSAASKVLLGLYAPVCANQPSLSSIVRDLQNDQRWDRPDVEADRHSAIESTESKSEPKVKDAAAPERAQPGFSSVRQNTTVVPRTAGTDQALRVHSYGTQHTTQHRTRNCCTVHGRWILQFAFAHTCGSARSGGIQPVANSSADSAAHRRLSSSISSLALCGSASHLVTSPDDAGLSTTVCPIVRARTASADVPHVESLCICLLLLGGPIPRHEKHFKSRLQR